ncbi:MAG: imidazole glycerol phosphate synthase subunit HisF [Candidatus Bathyarchaeota archaeon]|nr:imidazole glycerol phosphate synthase subunit HisF [Candidatus Bathyarchaeota archaeon]MDH5712915.1 imidazole glycerol phosphate synthase subunit HisF [Candidatus Bathyarchaeota archaeon]
MLCHRIIPCLDCDLAFPEGRVVKGIEFKQIRYAGIPWQLAEKYYEDGADEIVFLDITASHERRETMTHVIEKTSENVFVPLTVGGGIRSIEDARKVFNAGADKISINTAAIKNPIIVNRLARYFGSQACVVAIDAKRRYVTGPEEANDKIVIKTPEGLCWFECSIYGGRKFTGVDAIRWAMEVEERGAGEILLTSMDKDGTKEGYDIPLTEAINDRVSIPVIASGGCGASEHISEVFQKTQVSAALAASIFHYGTYSIKEVKEFLAIKGIAVRLG